jgi:hypothetical protein
MIFPDDILPHHMPFPAGKCTENALKLRDLIMSEWANEMSSGTVP